LPPSPTSSSRPHAGAVRHLAALVVTLLVAPLSWLLLAVGQDRSARALATGAPLVRPLACLVVAGLSLGLLATRRLAPLAPALTGAGYAGCYLALLVAPARVLGLFPHSVTVSGYSVDPTVPLRTGVSLVLGVSMLVVTMGSGRRRRRPSVGEVDRAADGAVERAADRAVDRAVDRPADVEWGPGRSRAALSSPSRTPADEPEFTARYLNQPRSAGNRRPNSYGPADNSGDRWPQTRQSIWPYE
jgi:hypothetical protein